MARRYEFYAQVARTNAPREHKIHIFELTCNVNVLMTPFLTIFRRFPTTFRRFLKIFQNCSEGQTNISEHFPNDSEHFPKITEDCRSRPKKVRRCFDRTATNSSVVEGTREKCYQT